MQRVISPKQTRLFGPFDDVLVEKICKHIWDAIRDKVIFFVDGRMLAEVLRVINAYDGKSGEYYSQTSSTTYTRWKD